MIEHEFDPFDHGEATIMYCSSTQEEWASISNVLQNGWGIAPQEMKTLVFLSGVEPRHFQVIDEEHNQFLLQRNRTGSERQRLVAACEIWCREQGIPTRELISATNGENFFSDSSDQTYSLSTFLEGTHFDGSREELRNVARQLPRLINALYDIPFAEEVEKSRSVHVRHNSEILFQLLSEVTSKKDIGSVPQDFLEKIPNIIEVSQDLQSVDFEHQLFQTTHRDLHPYNMLFKNKKLIAWYDFENVERSQRLRDIAFVLHRVSRTYGSKTEGKQDIGTPIKMRIGDFLNEFNAVEPLSYADIEILPHLIRDEVLRRIMIILTKNYPAGEFRKQLRFLEEASLFENL